MTHAAQSGNERALIWACEGESVLGVLHAAAGRIGVVIVVGGPQYRAGSHRLFVRLARALSAAGYPVLRFDARGMGDSAGSQRGFEQISADIGAAVDALSAACPQLRGVVLWGLCDGASASLLYVDQQADPRVVGLCLLNPWVRSPASQAKTKVRHYYTRRLLQPTFWRKLLRGGVRLSALSDLLRSSRVAWGRGQHAESWPDRLSYTDRMARAWLATDFPLLLLLSANDLTAREFETVLHSDHSWRGCSLRVNLKRYDIDGADHTLSSPPARRQLETRCAAWLQKLAADASLTPRDHVNVAAPSRYASH